MIVISASLIGVFLLSNLYAEGSSADFRPPTTNPQTQKEIWAGQTQTLSGQLNNEGYANSECTSLGESYALKSFNQNASQSLTRVTYWQFNTWGDVITDTTGHVITDWLQNPPAYDLNCWPNEPQVDWRDSSVDKW